MLPLAVSLPDLDTLFRAGELLVAAGAVGYLRKISRLLGVFDDYPPHRHIEGVISYPKGYAPGSTQREWGDKPDSCIP